MQYQVLHTLFRFIGLWIICAKPGIAQLEKKMITLTLKEKNVFIKVFLGARVQGGIEMKDKLFLGFEALLVFVFVMIGIGCSRSKPASAPVGALAGCQEAVTDEAEVLSTETPCFVVRYEACPPGIEVGDRVQVTVTWIDGTRGPTWCRCSRLRETCLESLGAQFYPGWEQGGTALLFEGSCQPCPRGATQGSN